MNRGQHPSDDILADLAMRLITGAVGEETMQHLSRCAMCEQRFREIAAEWERSAARVGKILEERTAAVEATDQTTASAWQRFCLLWGSPPMRWAAAAVVVILLIATLPRFVGSPSRASLTMLPPLTADVLPRALVLSGDNDKMIAGLSAYASEDFDAAIAALEPLNATGPADALRRVYLASAFAWTGRHERAIETLDGVPLDAVPDPWSAESRWMLYVSLTETGRHDRALSTLRELAAKPGAVGTRAQAVLEKQSRGEP